MYTYTYAFTYAYTYTYTYTCTGDEQCANGCDGVDAIATHWCSTCNAAICRFCQNRGLLEPLVMASRALLRECKGLVCGRVSDDVVKGL